MAPKRLITAAEHEADKLELLNWENQEVDFLLQAGEEEPIPAHITTMIQRYQERVDDYLLGHEEEHGQGGYEAFPWWAWAFVGAASLLIVATKFFFR